MADALVRSRQTSARATAVICGSERFDHATFADRCAKVGGLLDHLAARRGERVAILAANCYRYAEAYFGVPGSGRVLVPLNTRLSPAELVGIARAARPTVLVTDRDPGPLAAEVGQVIGFEQWEVELSRAPAVVPGAGVAEDDLALLCFTGARPVARRA